MRGCRGRKVDLPSDLLGGGQEGQGRGRDHRHVARRGRRSACRRLRALPRLARCGLDVERRSFQLARGQDQRVNHAENARFQFLGRVDKERAFPRVRGAPFLGSAGIDCQIIGVDALNRRLEFAPCARGAG